MSRERTSLAKPECVSEHVMHSVVANEVPSVGNRSSLAESGVQSEGEVRSELANEVLSAVDAVQRRLERLLDLCERVRKLSASGEVEEVRGLVVESLKLVRALQTKLEDLQAFGDVERVLEICQALTDLDLDVLRVLYRADEIQEVMGWRRLFKAVRSRCRWPGPGELYQEQVYAVVSVIRGWMQKGWREANVVKRSIDKLAELGLVRVERVAKGGVCPKKFVSLTPLGRRVAEFLGLDNWRFVPPRKRVRITRVTVSAIVKAVEECAVVEVQSSTSETRVSSFSRTSR